MAFVLTPFTSLRFGAVGFGEVMIAVALLLLLIVNKGHISIGAVLKPVISFWAAYLVLMLIGFSHNYFILGHVSGSLSLALFDLSAYLAVFATVMLLADQRLFTGTTPQAFFTTVFSAWAVVYSVLYFFSLVMPAIFGIPLRYYHFFSPMVDNIHQAAMVTSAMPLVMLFLAWNCNSLIRRFAFLAAALLFVQMAMESGSTKAMMAVWAGGVVGVLSYILSSGVGRKIGYGNVALALIVCAVAMSVGAKYSVDISRLATQFFTENDGSGARTLLYGVGFDHGMRSPLVGYGPGPHVSAYGSDYSDAHNTMLTIFLQGGLLSVFLFIVFLSRIAISVAPSNLLLGVLAGTFMYILGGDVLRRIPIWIILVGILYLANMSSLSSRGVSSSLRISARSA